MPISQFETINNGLNFVKHFCSLCTFCLPLNFKFLSVHFKERLTFSRQNFFTLDFQFRPIHSQSQMKWQHFSIGIFQYQYFPAPAFSVPPFTSTSKFLYQHFFSTEIFSTGIFQRPVLDIVYYTHGKAWYLFQCKCKKHANKREDDHLR